LSSEVWENHARWVCDELNEKARRLETGLLSEMLGRGDTKQIAEVMNLTPKPFGKAP
jgi:hypothetical protein